MQHLQQAAQLISYLRRESHEAARNSWVRWREIAEDIYGFDIAPNQIKFLINTGKVLGRELKSIDQAVTQCRTLEREEQIVVASLVELYIRLEKEHRERISTHLKEIWAEIAIALAFSNDEKDKISTQVAEWVDAKKENRFYTTITISASLLPITVDYLLRWFWLLYYNMGGFDSWTFLGGDADSWFFATQMIIIGPLILTFAVMRDRYIRRRLSDLFKDLKVDRLKPRVKQNPWNYALLAFYILSGMFIFTTVPAFEAPPIGFVLLVGLLILLPYHMILLRQFSKTIPHPKKVLDQLETTRKRILKTNLTPDENDEEIVNLGVNLSSVNELMNAFVLEAALFGALAFSGFLQIISSDYFSIPKMDQFTTDTYNILHSIVNLEAFNASQIQELLGKEALLSLMCYESLFCSVFFLSVIASRLRFNDLTDYIDKALRLASTFNVKEEALLQSGVSLEDERVNYLNHRIREQLQDGYRTQDAIEPIMEYMRFFRTLGITAFFIIIITGGLFISAYVSIILLFISVLSLAYFKLDQFVMNMKSLFISIQEFFFSVEKQIGWISWGVIGLAIFVNTLDAPGAGIIMFLGFLFVVLAYLFSLFLPEVVEVKSKVEDIFQSASAFQVMQRKLFKLGMALFFLGYGFKIQHWPGAGPMLITGLGFVAFYFLFTKKVKEGTKWVGYIVGIALATAFLGLLFKFQHVPGAKMLFYVNMAGIPVGTILVLLYWNKMNKLVRRVQIVFAVLIIMVQFNFTAFAVGNLNFNYNMYIEHETLWNCYYKIRWSERFPDQLTAEGAPVQDSLLSHAKRFTAMMGNNRYMESRLLNSAAWKVYEETDNAEILNEALLWMEYWAKNDKNRAYEYVDTHAALLFKLERYQESELLAIEAIEIAQSQDVSNYKSTEKLLSDIRKALSASKVDTLSGE